jgi:cobalt-zinc-cadmium efflux system outer membrane protein
VRIHPQLAVTALVTAWTVCTPPLAARIVPAPDSLRLNDVLAEAQARNPQLSALHAAAEAATYRAPEASTLPDPVFQIGVMNFGLPGFKTDMPTSMAPSVQLMQMVPFPGKLSLKGDIAAYSKDMAKASADEGWWNVREQAASMFYDLYVADRRLEVMRETLSLLEDFRQVARAMYVAGTGNQADVLRADVEVARMDGDIREVSAVRDGMAARLNALLDRPATTSVPSPVLGTVPVDVPARDTLIAWAEETRPALAGRRDAVARARKGVALADKQIWPDLTIGVTYGQRGGSAGPVRMGSAMVGFTLPIHAGSRQLAARDEAAAMERLAEAQLGSVRAGVDARVVELLAELDRARTLADLYRNEVIPEARSAVQSALASYRVGKVDFTTLVDAQMSVNRYRGELYELLGDYGKAVASLESAVGRPLPRTTNSVAEER